MSNKSKKHKKKKAKKAKVKVLSVMKMEPNRHMAWLDIENAPEPKRQVSTWKSFTKWLNEIWG